MVSPQYIIQNALSDHIFCGIVALDLISHYPSKVKFSVGLPDPILLNSSFMQFFPFFSFTLFRRASDDKIINMRLWSPLFVISQPVLFLPVGHVER